MNADQGIDGIWGCAPHYCGKHLAYRGEPFPSFFNGSLGPDAIGVGPQRTKKEPRVLTVAERHSLSAIMGGKAADHDEDRLLRKAKKMVEPEGRIAVKNWKEMQ